MYRKGPEPTARSDEPPETEQAKKLVLDALWVLKRVEPKEFREKQFRKMLREWHPDKNLDMPKMATVVFQFMQEEWSRMD